MRSRSAVVAYLEKALRGEMEIELSNLLNVVQGKKGKGRGKGWGKRDDQMSGDEDL